MPDAKIFERVEYRARDGISTLPSTNSEEMVRMRELHVCGRAGEIDIRARCCTTIPHPALVAGSLILHGRTVRRALPVIERLVHRWKRLLRPPRAWRGTEAPVSCPDNGIAARSRG